MQIEKANFTALSLILAMHNNCLVTTLIFLARSGRFLSAESAMCTQWKRKVHHASATLTLENVSVLPEKVLTNEKNHDIK